MAVEDRPWGYYEILHEEKNCKVKKITVNPGERLSYQYHQKRSEVWTIIQGEAYMLLNDELQLYTYGETIRIPQGVKHRVENKSNEDLNAKIANSDFLNGLTSKEAINIAIQKIFSLHDYLF